MTNPIDELLSFFEYQHLPNHLQSVNRRLGTLGRKLAEECGTNRETVAGLRKLLEAKDCFVRAKILGGKEDD